MHADNLACARRHACVAWNAHVGGLFCARWGYARRWGFLCASAIRASAHALGRGLVAMRAPSAVPLYLPPTENLCKKIPLGYDFTYFKTSETRRHSRTDFKSLIHSSS